MMPELPEGMEWRVAINGDDLEVSLVSSLSYSTAAGGTRKRSDVIAKESREMITYGRDYFGTQGADTAVTMANSILRRFQQANELSDKLGINVRVER